MYDIYMQFLIMKIAEIRKQSDKELAKQVAKTRQQLAGLQRERYVKDEKNVNLKRSLRRDLARMLGEQTARDLNQTEVTEEDK